MRKKQKKTLMDIHHSTNTHYWMNLGKNNDSEHAISRMCFATFRHFSAAMSTDPGPITHGNKNCQSRHKLFIAFQVEEGVVKYLCELGKREGKS